MASSFESGSPWSPSACAAKDARIGGRARGADGAPGGKQATADTHGEDRLWQAHASCPSAALRETLILHYLPYARTVAAGMYGRHLRHEVAFEDFLQWAIVGMIEAIDRYNPGNRAGQASQASFRTYALPRMRGAIIDGLEQISERQRQSGLQRQLMAQGVHPPASKCGDVCATRLLQRMAGVGMGMALSALLADTGMIAPEETAYADPGCAALEATQLSAQVRRLLRRLTPRESSVMNLHYLQGLSFQDIGRMLSISKGRVSQLHDQATARLRKSLGDLASW